VVLKRTYNNGAHDTYYVYDIFGNQTYVIPPLVTNPVSQLDDLCYQYKYDYRNRMVEKKLPGKQWESFVYDKLDRVIATGMALSPFGGTEKGYLISKYDALDRVVYTGWLQSTAPRISLQQQYNAETTNFSEKRLRPGTTIDVDNVAIAYTNLTVPTSGIKLLSVTYYDDYAYPGAVAIPTSIEGQDVAASVVGQTTGKWVRILTLASETLNEKAQIFYDTKYRVIRTATINHLGGYTRVDNKVDFSGKVQQTQTFHKLNSSSNELSVKDSYSYTDQDRLLLHTHRINGGAEQLIAKNTYDDLGRLVSKNVGGSDATGAIGLQKVDYRYNIRGWMTDINNDAPIGSAGFTLGQGDLFGFKINYNTVTESENGIINTAQSSVNGDVRPLYNGNISETFWISASDNQLRKYGYKYDALNRLLKAFYQKPISNIPVPKSYDEEISYDKNGNITSLKRKGNLDSPLFAIDIDDLNYVYNGNQLIRVNDNTNNPDGFQDNGFGATANDYAYDTFGNLTKDLNKGITNIIYNHLNLPSEIVFNGGGKINYIYNAEGIKLQKRVTTPNSNVLTDYQQGFQYENQHLKFFPHSEGYVNVTGTFFNYVFNYVDHLGNIRNSFAWDDKGGSLTIVEENHYYPFGLKHKAYNNQSYVFVPAENAPGYYRAELVQEGSRTPVNPYKYKYNGKELQDELGLNFYDYGARNYDAAIGRWMNIDPLAENSRRWTPYNYAYNNPMYFIDPDGMQATPPGDFYDRKGNYLGNDGNKDGRIYLMNEGMRPKSENKDVNWGGTLSEAHSNNLKNNSTEVGGLIVLNRTEEGKDFTIGEFETTGDKPVTGYAVEPAGPATTESGKDKRIPEGVYDLSPHASSKYPGSYKVSNHEVSKSRAILIHAGNNGAHTEGCILPGTNKTDIGVSGSKPKLKEVYNFIKENSKELPVKLIINEKIK